MGGATVGAFAGALSGALAYVPLGVPGLLPTGVLVGPLAAVPASKERLAEFSATDSARHAMYTWYLLYATHGLWHFLGRLHFVFEAGGDASPSDPCVED